MGRTIDLQISNQIVEAQRLKAATIVEIRRTIAPPRNGIRGGEEEKEEPSNPVDTGAHSQAPHDLGISAPSSTRSGINAKHRIFGLY